MIYVFFANGFEEIEAITTVDILKRAEFSVVTIGVGGKTIVGAHGIPVTTDLLDKEICLSEDLQAIVLPGGMPGTLNLEKSVFVKNAIQYIHEQNKLIAAICAAPSILGHLGLLNGKSATCFPGFEQELSGANLSCERVVKDGNIITAKGAGAAVLFALEIVAFLTSRERAEKIKDSLQ